MEPATVEPISLKQYEPARIDIQASSALAAGPVSQCFVYEDVEEESPQKASVASTEPPSPAAEAELSPQAPSAELSPQAPSTELSPEPPSIATGTPADLDVSATEEFSVEELPSLGSALHAAGECRRCNF